MNFDKNDIEWLIGLLVITYFHYDSKKKKALKRNPPRNLKNRDLNTGGGESLLTCIYYTIKERYNETIFTNDYIGNYYDFYF